MASYLPSLLETAKKYVELTSRAESSAKASEDYDDDDYRQLVESNEDIESVPHINEVLFLRQNNFIEVLFLFLFS